jgi:hypothetical protein
MKKLITQVAIISCATIMVSVGGKHCFSGQHENAQRSQQEDPLKELRQLANADPAKDFEAAKAKRDIHFIGVNGITLMVPGVNNISSGKRPKEYLKRYETRVVKGTGDVMTSDEQWPLTRKVLVYAEKYNKLVLQFLTEKEAKER